jgi:hypothetical protein
MPAPSPISVGADGAPVVEVLQDLQALLDDRVALVALDMGDKADAAGIVFVGRIVQTLCVHSQFSATFLSSNGQISAVQQKAQQE